jgi:hypothetical protein
VNDNDPLDGKLAQIDRDADAYLRRLADALAEAFGDGMGICDRCGATWVDARACAVADQCPWLAAMDAVAEGMWKDASE